jgi:cysteinyl-tRNA synthetase
MTAIATDAPLSLYNTLTRRTEPLVPGESGHVRMYLCGVTVYDRAHVGHARTWVVFDALARFLEWRGFRVTYVRNVTDIDDRIIERSAQQGISAAELGDVMTRAMMEDSTALGCRAPDVEPRATAHIEEMIALIAKLEEKGLAYRSEGDVYFDVAAFPPYGKLSHRRIDDLRAGARVEVGEQKRHPEDFALWKGVKPGEPFWQSPFGPGRPGWHIECSAMSTRYLGQPFDLHGGGEDLIFPHHENELAQSEGAVGDTFARHWMHISFLRIDEEQMSKSLGHFVTIRDAVARYPAEALRLHLLQTHYRSPMEFAETSIVEAQNGLARMYETLARVGPGRATAAGDTSTDAERCLADFRDALADDFNTPRALAALHDAVRAANRLMDAGKAEEARAVAGALAEAAGIFGLLQGEPEKVLAAWGANRAEAAGIAPDEIEALIGKRAAARRAKDFREADAIRGRLAEAGIDLKDHPDGTTSWSLRR